MKLPPLKFKIPDLKFKIPTIKIRIKTFRLKKFSKAQVFRAVLLVCLLGLGAAMGGFYGSYRAIKDNLPPVTDIETFRPKLITTVYSESGEVIKEFAEERRIEVPYSEIPDILVKAIVATEDPSFFRHHGIDFRGILRAVKEDFFKILRGRRLEGGSTITQQLARSLFLHREQNIRRKLKEAFLALQIEKHYSKENILELYCNHFELGHGVFGVETAANFYFRKTAQEMTLEEAALIAGIFRGPYLYSPYNNPKGTLNRRNHVLNRMAAEGYISRAQEEQARALPMTVFPLRRANAEYAAYFVEEVRRYLERTYGKDALYGAGLKVYTTLNPTLQKYAESALRRGLRDVENLYNGWRRDKPNLIAEGKENLDEEWLDTWENQTLELREVYDAIVLEAGRTEATVRIKNYAGKMANSDIAWTKARTLSEIIKRGDVVQVRINSVDEEKKEARVSLDQKPVRNGGFLAIEPKTGKILAMVGGYSFRESQFNRATQAKRQSGSAIKPFLYTAALENGYTLATVLLDEPTTFIDKWNGEPWSPPNYDRKYKGAVTFRRGLEESRNIITARLLEYVSPQTGVEYCKRFGITSPLYPYLSLSLGTFEMTMMELVSAFSVFPNKGVRARPYFISRIEDKDGNVLEETVEESMEVIPPQTAYMITSCLQGVIQRGTGIAAADLGWALGGKTGTTDQYSDAWFVGFSPSLCAGVWVGNETMVTLGERQSGAVAALPVWKDFFAHVIGDKIKEAEALGIEVQPEEFEVPPNLSFTEIDLRTGLLATPICLYPFLEVFVPGTEPFRYCTLQDHMRTLDYYLMEKVIEEH